jgi:hypothetical protein
LNIADTSSQKIPSYFDLENKLKSISQEGTNVNSFFQHNAQKYTILEAIQRKDRTPQAGSVNNSVSGGI